MTDEAYPALGNKNTSCQEYQKITAMLTEVRPEAPAAKSPHNSGLSTSRFANISSVATAGAYRSAGPQSASALALPKASPALQITDTVVQPDALPALAARAGNIPAPSVPTNPRAAKTKLFHNAPAPIAPPTQGLAQLNLKADAKDEKPAYNPDSPDFNIMKYYNKFIGRFKCPHFGCK